MDPVEKLAAAVKRANALGCFDNSYLRNEVRDEVFEALNALGLEPMHEGPSSHELGKAIIGAAKALMEDIRTTRRYAMGEMTEAECDLMHALQMAKQEKERR